MFRLGVALLIAAGALLAQASSSSSLDWQDRWDSYVQRTYSWQRVGMLGAETAFDQMFNLEKCGRPPYCFPHSFGRAMASRVASTSLELGAGALFREDIRRRPSGLTGFRKRVAFALIHAPLARGSDGEWRPAYSRFAGSAGAFVVSSEYAGRPLTTSRIVEAFGWSITDYFQGALLTEFEPDIRRIGMGLLKRIQTRRSRTTFADAPIALGSKP